MKHPETIQMRLPWSVPAWKVGKAKIQTLQTGFLIRTFKLHITAKETEVQRAEYTGKFT